MNTIATWRLVGVVSDVANRNLINDAEYGYDDDSQVTDLAHKQGQTTIGSPTYGYDAAAQRTIVGGAWARTTLPAALRGIEYYECIQRRQR